MAYDWLLRNLDNNYNRSTFLKYNTARSHFHSGRMISTAERKGAKSLRAAKRAPRRGQRTSLTTSTLARCSSTTSATKFRRIFSCCWSISWVLWIGKLPNCQWPLYPSCDWYQTVTFSFPLSLISYHDSYSYNSIPSIPPSASASLPGEWRNCRQPV